MILSLLLAGVLLVGYQPDITRCQSALPPLTDDTRSAYWRLQKDIMEHPVVQGKIPPTVNSFVNITLSLFPVEVLQLDPVRQVIEMSCFIFVMWMEPGLIWIPDDYGGLNVTSVSPSLLWTPMLTVVNEVNDKLLTPDEKTSLVLYMNGLLVLSMSRTLHTSCTMDLTYFPFDEQICTIGFQSLPQTPPLTVRASFLGMKHAMQGYSAAGEWTLVDLKWVSVKGIYSRQAWTMAELHTTVKRRPKFYSLSILGPMILCFIMNGLVFAIPPESGEKVSFVISLFITNAVFASYINGVVPRGFDEKTPLILVCVFCMWLFSVAVFIGTVVVLRKFHAEQKQTSNRLDECDEPSNRVNASERNDTFTTALATGNGPDHPAERKHPREAKNNDKQTERSARSTKSFFFKRSLLNNVFPAPKNDMDTDPEHPAHHVGVSIAGWKKKFTCTANCLDRIFLVLSLTVVAGCVLGYCGIMVNSVVSP